MVVGRRERETRGTDRRRGEGKRERREVGKTEGSGEERRERVKRGGRGVAKKEWSGEERRDGSGEGTRERRVEVIGSADGHRTHKSMQKSQHNCHRD